MKTRSLWIFLLLLSTSLLFAQNQLIGSWELVSSIVVDKDGNKQILNSNNASELLIFTPDHMAIFREKDDDKGKRTFNQSMIATYTLSGSSYVVKPFMASWKVDPKEKQEYTFKIEGDKYTSHGIISFEGTTYKVENVYQRLHLPLQETGDVVGTWQEIIDENENYIQIITPTHMFHIGNKNNAFDHSIVAGTTKTGDKIEAKRIYVSSEKINKKEKIEILRKVVDGKLYVDGVIYKEDGSVKDQWTGIMEKVKP